jgi:hypothetical protein
MLVKYKSLRWARHGTIMGETRNAYRILVRKFLWKRPRWRWRRRWEKNIKIGLREIGVMMGGNGNSHGLCPVAGFGIGSVELSCSATPLFLGMWRQNYQTVLLLVTWQRRAETAKQKGVTSNFNYSLLFLILMIQCCVLQIGFTSQLDPLKNTMGMVRMKISAAWV